jgi:hypothetical protein
MYTAVFPATFAKVPLQFLAEKCFATAIFKLFSEIFRYLATVSGPIRMKYGNEGEGGMDK